MKLSDPRQPASRPVGAVRIPAAAVTVFAVAAVFVASVFCVDAFALDDTGYHRVPRSPDGSGVVYMGRETASVMGHEGADWLERSERATEERPDLLLATLALRPGLQVADIGAGTGYYSWRIAQKVAPGGRVMAVDVQPEMLALLGAEMKRRAVTNVVPVLGSDVDPGLAPETVDLVLMVDVYHEFDHPREMLAALVRSLRPGGRIVFVEYRGEDPGVPIKTRHKMTVEQIRREAVAAGLAWKETVETLPWQHIVVFTRAPGR